MCRSCIPDAAMGSRHVHAGERHAMPLMVNLAGMIPLIFCKRHPSIPGDHCKLFYKLICCVDQNPRSWRSEHAGRDGHGTTGSIGLLYFLMVVSFTFFYTSVLFETTELRG